MRNAARQDFIAIHKWADAACIPFAADASRRRYFRLQRDNGDSCLVMDMPIHPEERFQEFIVIDNYLRQLGLSAPEIYAIDHDHQFALLEDFGDDTYTRLLNAGASPAPLYQTAIDAAAYLQAQAYEKSLSLPHYDTAAMAGEIGWFIEWYAPVYMGRAITPEEQAEFYSIVRNIFDGVPKLEPTLLLRDFHVDNFMWLKDRNGIKACGILDFQDAKWGSAAYDLISILQDARRDLDPALADELYARYLAQRYDIAPDDFAIHYAVMGMLRHARILGNFIRSWLRDDKTRYLQFMPRIQNQLAMALPHPVIKPFRDWLENTIPHWHTPIPETDKDMLRGFVDKQLFS